MSSRSSDGRPEQFLPREDMPIPRLYRLCDQLSEALFYLLLVAAPWLFGSATPQIAMWLTYGAFVLGGLLLFKWLIRLKTGFYPARWSNSKEPRWVVLALAVLTVLILGYTLISALNARATFLLYEQRFEYHEFNPKLPHSYDKDATWHWFYISLGLAFFFWALRDWLLGKTPREQRRTADTEGALESVPIVPQRLERLLWVLCINGAILGLEGILQRFSGTNKLLWLVEPRWIKEGEGQFGPYAYRSNAAQYFNLLWPVCLGFWWTLSHSARVVGRRASRVGQGAHVILLPCAIIMAVCPIVSVSRGGAVIAAGMMVAAFVILLVAARKGSWSVRLGLMFLFGAMVVGGFYLGWDALEARFRDPSLAQMSGRAEIYRNAVGIAKDFPLFGTGPGSFAAIYQLYRKDTTEKLAGYLHDDWLETLITYGQIGTGIILLMLLLAILRWFGRGGIYLRPTFPLMLGLAIAGCLAHAKFDFPLQIYSILLLFVTWTSLLFCLSRKP